jgi:hypothetical protein
MEFIIVLMIPVLALGVGWLYGRNQVNPFDVKGKNYYNQNEGE